MNSARVIDICILLLILTIVLISIMSMILIFLEVSSEESTKNVKTVEVVLEDEDDYYIPKLYYTVTEEERYLLAKLANSEASICSEECQRDVVSVVFNRLESGKWRKDMNGDNKITVYDIIYYPNAFTPATNGAIDKQEPTSKDYKAVDYVIKNGPTVPTEVRYFRTDYDFSWDGYENYKVIDNVYFGYFVDWQKGAW